MSLARAAVLRPGDRVRYDGADHVVVALAGTSVRLRSDDNSEAVVLASYLMASPEFAVVGNDPLPAVEPFGLLDGLPTNVLHDARAWNGIWSRWRPGCRSTRRWVPSLARGLTRC